MKTTELWKNLLSSNRPSCPFDFCLQRAVSYFDVV